MYKSLFIFLFFLNSAFVFSAPEFPAQASPLLDEARLLTQKEFDGVSQIITAMNASQKIQVAVFIPSSLQGYDIESFSLSVAEKWALGTQKKDDGLLLVIAPKERIMRIEVGYGLEGDLPDAINKRMITQIMTPAFREARYGDGIALTLIEVSRRLGISLDPSSIPVIKKTSNRQSSFENIFFIVFILFIFFFNFISKLLGIPVVRNSRSRGHTGFGGFGGGSRGGGFGGGGFSGGGGGFGGGGASGRW